MFISENSNFEEIKSEYTNRAKKIEDLIEVDFISEISYLGTYTPFISSFRYCKYFPRFFEKISFEYLKENKKERDLILRCLFSNIDFISPILTQHFNSSISNGEGFPELIPLFMNKLDNISEYYVKIFTNYILNNKNSEVYLIESLKIANFVKNSFISNLIENNIDNTNDIIREDIIFYYISNWEIIPIDLKHKILNRIVKEKSDIKIGIVEQILSKTMNKRIKVDILKSLITNEDHPKFLIDFLNEISKFSISNLDNVFIDMIIDEIIRKINWESIPNSDYLTGTLGNFIFSFPKFILNKFEAILPKRFFLVKVEGKEVNLIEEKHDEKYSEVNNSAYRSFNKQIQELKRKKLALDFENIFNVEVPVYRTESKYF
jgi:hypothetical protein